MPARSSSHRNEFSTREDDYLAQYIAKYNPQRDGRTGNKLYQRLVENADGKWPWHKRHTWQSWRERYRTDQARFDRRIAKLLLTKSAAKSSGSGPSASPAPPPPPANVQPRARERTPESPPLEKRERVPYTMDDDDNLAEYLAANSLSRQGRQGKNLYEAIADEPWGQRHSWQSWHERYRKNRDYFDRRIKRIHAVEDGEDVGDEAHLPRPRTVDGTTRYSLSQARVHVKREKVKEKEREREQEKRKRASRGDESAEGPPRKKTRVEEEEPVAGPSRSRGEEPEDGRVPEKPEVEVAAASGAHDEGPQEEQAETGDGVRDSDDAQGGEEQVGEDHDREDEAELEEDEQDGHEDEDEDEEELSPVGSDDYRGEIFDEQVPESDAEGQDGSDSDREQEEAELMLSDDPFPGGQDVDEALGEDADRDVDMGGDETVVGEGDVPLSVSEGDGDENPFDDDSPHDVHIPVADDDEAEPHVSTTPPSGASPPARAQNARIEHDIDAQPDTPELSPAEDANARRRREHGHEPAPARKHVKRILRKRGGDEDFFGTPSTSTAGTVQNSPTARHVAQRATHAHVVRDSAEEGKSPRRREHEPPRLDEGAWNTAFTDARGRSRASPERPRRSGVDLEIGDAEAEEDGEGDGDGETEGVEEDEEVDAAPLQWPPVRGVAKGKAKGKSKEEVAAPATPARSARDKGKAREVAASPGEGRVVTTEHILSVKTIRTVERRPGNAHLSGGVAAPGAVREPAQDHPSSPRTLVQEEEEDVGVDADVKAEPTQRHPFSQLEPRGALASRASSVFPRVGGGAKDKGGRKDDIARMQRMLAASRRAATEEKGQEKEKDMDGNSDGLREDRESFIRRLANGGGPGRASELGTRSTSTWRRSPVGTTEDVRRREQRLARFQEREESLRVAESVPPLQSSPLARRGSNPAVGEIIPHASTSRGAQSVQNPPTRAVDKGKERAELPPSGVAGGYGQHPRQQTTNQLGRDFSPAPQDRLSVVRRNRHAPRQSLPSMPSFALEEDPYLALGHMFHPPPSGSGLARVYTLPPRPSHSPADPPLYAALPAHERARVKELGIQCMLAAMARNHGFGLEIVRGVCAMAGSMEKTDWVLRDMRESANRQANASLRKMFTESDREESGEASEEDGAEGEDEDELPPEEDGDVMDEGLPGSSLEADEGDSAEVESVLGEDTNSWLDDAPHAESSHICGGTSEDGEDGMDVDVDVSHVAGTSARRPFRIKVLPKEPAPPAAYSPPKKTRASHFIKRSRKADLAQSAQRGQESMEASADPFAIGVKPAKPRYAEIPAGSIGQLSKYGAKEWTDVENKYGPGAAKIMMGKALAKLLPDYRQ